MSKDDRLSTSKLLEETVNGRWLTLEVGYDESYMIFKTLDNCTGDRVLFKSHLKEQHTNKFIFDLGLNIGKLFFTSHSDNLIETELSYWVDIYAFNGSKDFESLLRNHPPVAVYLVMQEITATDFTQMLYKMEVQLSKNVIL